MEKLKSILRRLPSLYHFIQDCYGKLHLTKEYLLKTNIDEKEEKRWAERHLHEGNDWAVQGYWDIRSHPAAKFLLKRIESFYPFSSILEIGCNCGPNLYLIAKRFPNVKIKGIDINSAAVQSGNELLAREGVTNVNLLVGKAYDLSQFPDKSFDVVFTKAVLSHIGPAKISKVIEEIVRVCKKTIILVEYHDSSEKDGNGLGIRLDYSHRWKRNYTILLKKFIPEAKIKYTKIPDEVWDGEWGEMGYLIEVIL